MSEKFLTFRGFGTNDSPLGRTLLQAGFWVLLVGILWTLDTLTKMHYRERTGVGLDNFRLFTEQGTSAIGVLAMVIFVAWWLNHFPIRKASPLSTILGHVVGSLIFTLGHYSILIMLRKLVLSINDIAYVPPASLLSNLVFEYQKDVKIYLGIVALITIYRLYLGGENRLQLRPKSKQKILVQTGSGESVLSYEQIDYLESARNYVVVHSGDREYLIRNTMSGLLEVLAGSDFVRTHRSFAVNVARVEEIRPVDSGYVVRINGDKEVPLGRTYREAFRHSLTDHP